MLINKEMRRRGVSPVIATVLLILIVIIVVFILAVLLIPNLRENLFGSDACFNVINDVKFDGVKATSFSLKIDNEDVFGFRVGLFAAGVSNTIDVTEGSTSEILKMLGGAFGGPLEVNNRGGVRTYVANGLYERIDIFPILKSGHPEKCCQQYLMILKEVPS